MKTSLSVERDIIVIRSELSHSYYFQNTNILFRVLTSLIFPVLSTGRILHKNLVAGELFIVAYFIDKIEENAVAEAKIY